MGTFEILVIIVIALIVIGPDKLPEYARKFGKLMRDFRRMTSNLTGEMKKAIDLYKETEDIKRTTAGMSAGLDEEAKKIESSLDKAVGEIARTMGVEAEGVKKTLSEGTDELSQILTREVTGIKKSADDVINVLDSEVKELTRTLDEGTKKLGKALGVEAEKSSGAAKAAPGAAPKGVNRTAMENFRKASGRAGQEAAKVKETASVEPKKAAPPKMEPPPEAEAPPAPAQEPGEEKTGGDSAGGDIGA